MHHLGLFAWRRLCRPHMTRLRSEVQTRRRRKQDRVFVSKTCRPRRPARGRACSSSSPVCSPSPDRSEKSTPRSYDRDLRHCLATIPRCWRNCDSQVRLWNAWESMSRRCPTVPSWCPHRHWYCGPLWEAFNNSNGCNRIQIAIATEGFLSNG